MEFVIEFGVFYLSSLRSFITPKPQCLVEDLTARVGNKYQTVHCVWFAIGSHSDSRIKSHLCQIMCQIEMVLFQKQSWIYSLQHHCNLSPEREESRYRDSCVDRKCQRYQKKIQIMGRPWVTLLMNQRVCYDQFCNFYYDWIRFLAAQFRGGGHLCYFLRIFIYPFFVNIKIRCNYWISPPYLSVAPFTNMA